MDQCSRYTLNAHYSLQLSLITRAHASLAPGGEPGAHNHTSGAGQNMDMLRRVAFLKPNQNISLVECELSASSAA